MHSKLFSSIRVLPVQSALSFIDCRQRWEIEDGEEILAAGPLLHEQRSGIMHAIRNFGPKWLLYKGFFFKNPSCMRTIGGQHSFLRTNERSGFVNSLNTPMMIHNQITK